MYRHLYMNLNLFRVIPPIGVRVESFENFNYDVLDVLTYIRELEKSAPKPITEPIHIEVKQQHYKPNPRAQVKKLSPISFAPVGENMDESDPEIQFLCGRISDSSTSSEDETPKCSKQGESQEKRDGIEDHLDVVEEEEPDYRSSLPQWCRDAIDKESDEERNEQESDHYKDFMTYSNENIRAPYHGYRNVGRYIRNEVIYNN